MRHVVKACARVWWCVVVWARARRGAVLDRVEWRGMELDAGCAGLSWDGLSWAGMVWGGVGRGGVGWGGVE